MKRISFLTSKLRRRFNFLRGAFFWALFWASKEMDSERSERITTIYFLASKTFRSFKVTGVRGRAPSKSVIHHARIGSVGVEPQQKTAFKNN